MKFITLSAVLVLAAVPILAQMSPGFGRGRSSMNGMRRPEFGARRGDVRRTGTGEGDNRRTGSSTDGAQPATGGPGTGTSGDGTTGDGAAKPMSGSRANGGRVGAHKFGEWR